jgi:DNA-binding IclR family transcriptional regulator
MQCFDSSCLQEDRTRSAILLGMAGKSLKKIPSGKPDPALGYATPALEKGLDILELLARERHGLTKSEVARALQRTVSEIFRMLVCLQRRGYIVETQQDRYVLSLRLFQLVQEHPPTERLLSEALPRMHILSEKLEQSCHLGVLEGGHVVILAQTNARASLGFFVKAGSTVDLMLAASGQVILAHLPSAARERALADWRTETGRGLPADLGRHLKQIERRGFETRKSYQVQGVINISCPVMDESGRAVAALTVPFIQRLGASISLREAEVALREEALALSKAIGARHT